MIIQANNISIFYEKSGNGQPLLFLHGNGEDHHIFDPLAEKLSTYYTIYAIDSRNHGHSEKTDVYSYETMAEDIYHFIKELNLPPVNIVGFSDGAIIALLLCMHHEEIIHKAALLGVNLKPSDFTEKSLSFIQTVYTATKNPLFRLMLEEPDIELEDIKDIPTPMLLVAGEHDMVRPEIFADLQRTLPHAALLTLQGHNHDSYVNGNALLAPDLLSFLGR